MIFASLVFATPIHALTIKIATISPEGTFWMKSMREGAKEIKQRTDGRVKFKFYPGGVMGNDASVLRKMRIGQLHGGAVPIGTIVTHVPDTMVYMLPFLFDTLQEAEDVRAQSDAMLMALIEQNGFVSMGIAQGGFTYLMSKQPIHGFEDVRQQKSWVPENSEIGLSVFNYIGASPVSLPISDVLTGLQTGLIDSIITSPIGAVALQWHTHVNYVVDLPLNYLSATLIIDKKTFNKMKPADQQVVREVMGDVYRKIDERNKVDNMAAREALVKNGVEFVSLTQAEKQEWYRAGDHVITDINKKYSFDKKFYDYVTDNAAVARR